MPLANKWFEFDGEMNSPLNRQQMYGASGHLDDQMCMDGYRHSRRMQPQSLQHKLSQNQKWMNMDDSFVVYIPLSVTEPNDISMKTIGSTILVEEKGVDLDSFLYHEVSHRYVLSNSYEAKNLITKLSSNGYLKLEVPSADVADEYFRESYNYNEMKEEAFETFRRKHSNGASARQVHPHILMTKHRNLINSLQRGLEDTILQKLKMGNNIATIAIDVGDAAPQDVDVKAIDNIIKVEINKTHPVPAKCVLSQITHRYALPSGLNADDLVSHLSEDGILTLTLSPLNGGVGGNMRRVQIQQTRPLQMSYGSKKNLKAVHFE